MDLSFGTLDIPVSARPAKLDFIQLASGLAAMQAGSRTAMVETRLAAARHRNTNMADALILSFGNGGRSAPAALALCGSFHPKIATRRLTCATHRIMNAPFTLAG